MRRSLLSVIVVLVACGGAEPQPAGRIVARDSGGVEIVDHPAGYEASLPRWEIVPEPIVDIGGREEPGHDLHLVGGAARLGDGRIVVVNRGSAELRVFDSTGKYLQAIGRRGQGPGEFASLGTLQRLPGDSLIAFDNQLRRASLFAPSGQFVGTAIILAREERRFVYAVARVGDGRYLGVMGQVRDYRETSGPVRRDSSMLVVLNGNGAVLDTLAVVPDFEAYPDIGREGGHVFPTMRLLEFGRTSVYIAAGNRVFVGTNEPDGIRVYSADGTLHRIIRSGTPPEKVTDAHRQQRLKENLADIEGRQASEQIKAEWRQNEANPRFADVFPYYERLLVGTDHSLWVELARRTEDEGRRYVVYDSAGIAVATVQSVDRVRPYEVGPDRIIGLWRDPDEANHVRVYRVRR